MKAYIVEKDLLQINLKVLKQRAGDAPIWAILKGNGYGLGVAQFANFLAEQGINRFGVTELDEAQAIRELSLENISILMLQPVTNVEILQKLLALDVIFSVSSQDDAIILNGEAQKLGMVAEAHLKIDVGMGRYGFFPKEADAMESIFRYMDNIAISGAYTHFPCANGKSAQVTQDQFTQFRYAVNQLEGKGLEIAQVHCCNSAAFLRFDNMNLGGVRLGSALLGRVRVSGSGLRRVGYCSATVDELKWLNKGHGTGYGAAWVAKKPTKVAVLPIGWYHGFGVEYGRDTFRFRDCVRGALSFVKAFLTRKKLTVLIGDNRCPVLGHLGMLHTVVDVTNVPCVVGDTARIEINPVVVRGMDVIFQ